MDWNLVWDTIVSWLSNTGIKIVIALVILLVSFRIITIVGRKIEKRLANGKHKLDKTLTKTLIYVAKVALRVVVVVCLIGYLGIDTSGLTALIASAGVTVGLALNGALSNLAGGALILISRPFRVDDYIEAQGYEGTVEDIRITVTRLRTSDNKVVYIPNGALSSGTIVNYSEKDLRRVDITVSIAYENDYKKAKELLEGVCNAHEKIIKEPLPIVRMVEHASSSINIVVKVWTKNDDYWDVKHDLLESIKETFDSNGIEIPYNQLDVRVKNK